ncbi:hypothetical protein PARMER_01822 [Parabacteroides merdae ATCC 43184]|nr:hypothetical protein PARMER_01822 [Parabacteroides merdae ATCC 43184]
MIYDLCGTEINRKSKIINFFLLSKSIKLHKFQNENFFITLCRRSILYPCVVQRRAN